MRIGELEISPAAIIAAAALLQLLVVAAISASSKKKAPKMRLRGTELALLGSACAFIIAITIAHMSTAAPHQQGAAPVQASVAGVARHHQGSCNSIHREMASSEVEGNLGKADEVRSDEETRGPGAAVWIYRDSRCAVHIFDGKVEFVE